MSKPEITRTTGEDDDEIDWRNCDDCGLDSLEPCCFVVCGWENLGWFMMPFFNAPELTIPLYFGLGCFFALHTPKVPNTTEEDTTYTQLLLQMFIYVTVHRAVILLFAWIAFLFV